MRRRTAGCAFIFVALLLSQTAPVYLPNGWRASPAGQEAEVGPLPLSAVLSPDGRRMLVLSSGFDPPSIAVIDTAGRRVLSRTPAGPDAWLGLAFSPKGDRVYVGGGAEAAVREYVFDGARLTPERSFPVAEPARRTSRDFVGDVAFSPDGRLLYAVELYQNSVAVINPQSGRVIDRFKTGRRPYRIMFHPGGRWFFVSAWADGMVLQHETDTGKLVRRYLLAAHPTDMIWVPGRPKPGLEGETSPYVSRIFVTVSNTNSVRVLGVTEAGDIRPAESINLAMWPLQPAGMTPSALAYSAAERRLYVACSDENAVAVVDVSENRSTVLGYIPAGPYPTAARVLPDGWLAILAAGGSARFVESPGPDALAGYTRVVRENSPYSDRRLENAGTGEGNPVPSWPADPTPIQHVVYVLADQGWTYDQVFGDLPKGKGDRSLVRYGEEATPNLRALAREFVLVDNFRVIGEALEDGYNWSVAAIAPDYVRRLWPGSAAGRRRWNIFDETEPAATPPAGYLWTNARAAEIPFAVYSSNRPSAGQAAAFLNDLARFEKSGDMPRLVFVRFTSGAASDNDRALGALVAGLARSRFWPRTAIFMTVAHTGGGADHVDPHRAPALVVSPYVKRGMVDSTSYNTASMLRTIGLIAGLQPMTQFDAAARPMSACFQAKPDPSPPGGPRR